MAQITIRLRINPETGKKDIHIGLRSDEDALPHEHEQKHKAIVDKLIEGGILNAEERGEIVVEREEEMGKAVKPSVEGREGRKAQEQGQ